MSWSGFVDGPRSWQRSVRTNFLAMREPWVAAQNRRGLTTEPNHIVGAQSFSPYRIALSIFHREVFLVRTQGVPVMFPNNGFHLVGIRSFDGFENLPVFFLSLR